jgi:peptidoglycan-associated lipoprotein
LVTAGIQPDRVFTISYGEARPAETGHNEAAWSKNRRAVFVLLTPK